MTHKTSYNILYGADIIVMDNNNFTEELDFLEELDISPELINFTFIDKPKKKNEISLKDELELCPLCGEVMVIKNGRYGYFWSCKRFPKCRGSKNIDRLHDLNLTRLDLYEPESFIASEPFSKNKSILSNEKVPEYIKPLVEAIESNFYKGLVNDDSLRGKVSGLLDYLHKKEERFLLAQFSYFIYKVELEELPERFDFFLIQFISSIQSKA